MVAGTLVVLGMECFTRIHALFNRKTPDDSLMTLLHNASSMLACRGNTGLWCCSTADEAREATLAEKPVAGSVESVIFIHQEDKVGIKTLRAVVSPATQLHIFLSYDGFTPSCKKHLVGSKTIQVMHFRQLLLLLHQHILVPRVRRLAPEEAREALALWGIDNVQRLPKLSESDPMAEWFFFRDGDVVLIERNMPMQPEQHPTYRLVVRSFV